MTNLDSKTKQNSNTVSTNGYTLADRMALAAFGSAGDGVGATTVHKLLDAYGTPSKAWQALSNMRDVKATVEPTERIAEALRYAYEMTSPESLWKTLEKEQIGIIGFEDPEYPARLREIYNPPMWLFYKGNKDILSYDRSVAMVGARRCSPYGRNVANMFSNHFSMHGIVVISGGALGVDTYSHQGALKGMTPTIAVMGCGLDMYYPRSNRKMFEEIIAKGGTLLSEYGPGMAPQTYHFPMRNRILSGMAAAVIVVEAKSSSGSLITADAAINEGRDVFAVPGSVLGDDFAGNHWLISQGAILLDRPELVAETYGWTKVDLRKFKKDSSHKAAGMLSFTEEEEAVLDNLSNETVTSFDELAAKVNLPSSALHTALLTLEIKQCISRDSEAGYILLELGRNQVVH